MLKRLLERLWERQARRYPLPEFPPLSLQLSLQDSTPNRIVWAIHMPSDESHDFGVVYFTCNESDTIDYPNTHHIPECEGVTDPVRMWPLILAYWSTK